MAAETIKQISQGGVVRDIEDATARTLIQSLQNALDFLTNGDTTSAIESFNEIISFLENVEDSSTLAGIIAGIQTSIASKVTAVNGKGLSTNDFTDAEKTKLAGIAAGAQVNPQIVNGLGETTTGKVLDATQGKALKDYIDGKIAEVEVGETVVISPDEVDVLDSHESNTILAAPTARQMKMLFDNLMIIFNALAPVAFTEGKPTLNWVGAKSTYTFGLASADEHITVTAKDGSDNTLTGAQDEGTEMNITISVASGYKFSAAPTATMGGNSITVTQSGSNYTISIGALAGNVVITAAATEIGSYSVSIPSGAMFCDSNGDAVSTPSITEGDNLSCYIRPENGKRWSTTPSSTGANVTLLIGSIYQITASNIQADITISGATETIPTYAVTMPSTGNGIASVALTDTSGNALTSPVVEGTGIKVVITPSSNYRITVGTITMGSDTLVENTDYTVTDNNGVKTITIASVTGAVSVTATAAEVVTYAIRNHLLNMSSSNAASTIEKGDTFTAQISADSGCTSNNDLKVLIGGAVATLGTDYTFTNGTLEIEDVAGDIDIIASAYTDVITFKTTATGTTTLKLTGGGTDWSAQPITTLVNGDAHTPDANGVFTLSAGDTISFVGHDINEITVSDITAIKSIDFGGAKVSLKNAQFNGYSNLESIENLVCRPYQNSANALYMSFTACSSLKEVDLSHYTINGQNTMGYTFQKCSSLEKVDLCGMDLSGITSFEQTFAQCGNLEFVDMICPIDTTTITITKIYGDAAGNFTMRVGEIDLSNVTNSNYNGLSRVTNLICTTATPPDNSLLTYMTGLTAIYVPADVVSAYKSAWGSVENIIHPVTEYTE